MKTKPTLNWTVKTLAAGVFAFMVTLAGHSPALEGVSTAIGQTSALTSGVTRADKTRSHLLQIASEIAEEGSQPAPNAATVFKLRAIEPAAHSAAAQERYERSIAKAREDTLAPSQSFYRLHLASVTDPEDVSSTIERLKTFGSPQLSGANFFTLGAAPRGVALEDTKEVGEIYEFTRIFAGEFPSREIAQQACRILRSDGQYCSVLLVSQ